MLVTLETLKTLLSWHFPLRLPKGCATQGQLKNQPLKTMHLRGCGTWGHGLVVDLAALGLQLDLILKAFSNLNGSTFMSMQLGGTFLQTRM